MKSITHDNRLLAGMFVSVFTLLLPVAVSATAFDASELVKFTGEAASDTAGRQVHIGGDVNGDGYDDILVAAPYDDTAANNAGAVHVIYGSATQLTSIDLSESDVKIYGNSADDALGTQIAADGDINGDGYYDIVVSSSLEDTVATDAGAVYVIYGSDSLGTSIAVSAANVTIRGADEHDNTGSSFASSSDVNDDGYDDLIIGAPQDDDSADNAGAVYVIYGGTALSSTITAAAADVTLTGESSGDTAGISIGAGADINGDSIDDFIVGAWAEDTGASNAGAVYAIFGSDSLSSAMSLTNADVKITGEAENDTICKQNASCSLGDVNGDGFADIIIGAATEDTGGASAGAVYIIHGSNSMSSTISASAANTKIIGEEALDFTGYSVSASGDLNDDGYEDVVFGAFKEGSDPNEAGAAYVVLGSDSLSATIDASQADIKITGEEASNYAGRAVSNNGDVNGDGINDVLVGADLNGEGGGSAGAAYLGYFYVDADKDGVTGAGGLIGGTDCNDNDGTVTVNQTYYADDDGDGYGDATDTLSFCASTPPGGYVTNSTDCSDADADVNTNQTYYVDGDGDGYGDATDSIVSCTATAPDGYASNNSDSNDNDADNDGSETGTDCNDADDSISENQTYYADDDGDGLGDASDSTSVCSLTAPDGYVTDSSDTNDAVVNNGVEIAGDGIDNDGDGAVDEVNTISENGAHPGYGGTDASDTSLPATIITAVEGVAPGIMQVTFADNSVYAYSVLNASTPIIKQYDTTGLYVVLHGKGKTAALVSAYDGTVHATKTLAKNKKYSTNVIKLWKARKKDVAVIISKKKKKVRVIALRLKINKQEFGKKATKTFKNKKIRPAKTKKKKNTIQLKNKKGKILKKYLITKKFKIKKK